MACNHNPLGIAGCCGGARLDLSGDRGARCSSVSLLLPQTRTGTVQQVRLVDIHGDRYMDLGVSLDDAGAEPVTGRVSALACPPDLAPGDRVLVSFTMGVMTKVLRA